MSDKSISELLEAVSKTKKALEKAQEEYNAAKADLASSPLLAEAGLQVIGNKNDDSNLTTEKAILKALAGGKEMSVDDIATKAAQLKGITIPRHNITFHLAKLKKAKVITNPKRAHYKQGK